MDSFLQVIDDSEYEGSEQFELALSAPTYNTVVGPADKATVIINGPNDGKNYYLSFYQGTKLFEILVNNFLLLMLFMYIYIISLHFKIVFILN